MRIDYKRLSLRPYPGEILLFNRLDWMRAKYTALTGNPYEFEDELTGGRFVFIAGKRSSQDVYLVYGRKPHVIAHEFSHVLLRTFERINAHPADGNGEPFCYMLSQLMLESV